MKCIVCHKGTIVISMKGKTLARCDRCLAEVEVSQSGVMNPNKNKIKKQKAEDVKFQLAFYEEVAHGLYTERSYGHD